MAENQVQNPPAEKVIALSASLLEPFQGHPFQVASGEEMEQLKESIREYGVLSPLLVRPRGDGRYEIVSGHRRKAACEALGITELPVLVREMTDDEAVILMVDSNIQREHILPSEKAFAYDVPFDLMSKLMISVDNTKFFTRSGISAKNVEKILNEGWLHFDAIQEGLNHED